MGLVWLSLVLNCMASIRQQSFTAKAMLVWAAGIVFVPVLGMAAYLTYCLFRADYSFLKFILGSPSRLDMQNHVKPQLPSNLNTNNA